MKNAILLSLAVPISALLLFTGCRGAVSTPDPIIPSPRASELLLGLWIGREERSEGQYNLISLTFTPERFIYTVSRYDTDNTFRWARSESGTWTATEDTITKQETWYDFEIEEQIDVETERTYSRLSDGELIVAEWDRISDEDADPQSFRYVESIPDTQGTWQHDTGLANYDDGSTSRTTYEYVINQDTFTETAEVYVDGALFEEWRIHGNVVSYDEANLYVNVSITEFSMDREDDFTFNQERFVGHKLRWAFAPTADENRFFVSRFWHEQNYHQESRMWYFRADHQRYGIYWMDIERQ